MSYKLFNPIELPPEYENSLMRESTITHESNRQANYRLFKDIAREVSICYIRDTYNLATKAVNGTEVIEIRKDGFFDYIFSIFTHVSALSSNQKDTLTSMLYTARDIKRLYNFQ